MLELSCGRGGEEAALLTRQLAEMYHKYLRKQKVSYQIVEQSKRGAGLRSMTMLVDAPSDQLSDEAGEHICQRKTRTRKKDRIHTTSTFVKVLPVYDSADQLDDSQIQIQPFKGSGPGGQHKNKTETAIRATHKESGLSATVNSGRSQDDNIKRAKQILRSRYAFAQQSKQKARQSSVRSAQTDSVRTYDFIRHMIRDRRYGKCSKLQQVLAGELGQLKG